jgi:hypothetical protein
MVALVASLILKVNYSSVLTPVSSISIRTTLVVWPGAKVSEPLAALYS